MPEAIEWTCNVCKKWRDDADIAVAKRVMNLPWLEEIRHRYCRDNPECKAGVELLLTRSERTVRRAYAHHIEEPL